MKYHYLISFLLLSFIFNSCHKYDTEEEVYRKDLTGDYEWTNSDALINEGASGTALYSYTPAILEHNYGLRIRKNDKCFLFEDGKQIDSGELLSIEDSVVNNSYYAGMSTTYHLITIDWNKRGNMRFTNANFYTKAFPVEGFKNYFKKK